MAKRRLVAASSSRNVNTLIADYFEKGFCLLFKLLRRVLFLSLIKPVSLKVRNRWDFCFPVARMTYITGSVCGGD